MVVMFSVLFEVHPKPEQWDAYLNYAKMLRPELEAIDGFVDNTRYRSLTREGWILSLSSWRDEKSLIRWRTKVDHHGVQERGRTAVLSDYHLRVGQVTHDSRIPEGYTLQEQRLDETEVGEGTTVMLIDAKRTGDAKPMKDLVDCAAWLGLPPFVGALSWDIFDAVLTPGNCVVMLTWRDGAAAQTFEDSTARLLDGIRFRRIRIVLRDCSTVYASGGFALSETMECTIAARLLNIIRMLPAARPPTLEFEAAVYMENPEYLLIVCDPKNTDRTLSKTDSPHY